MSFLSVNNCEAISCQVSEMGVALGEVGLQKRPYQMVVDEAVGEWMHCADADAQNCHIMSDVLNAIRKIV
ncbi:hypothetical protein T06_3979 [Trichinella sp. T6]|nr:hypothetical protein T06_3979 [Trichinella sp. T6]